MIGCHDGYGCTRGFPFKEPWPNTLPGAAPTHNSKPTKVKDTQSIRELVQAIDSHVELIDLEITSNPNVMPTIAQP